MNSNIFKKTISGILITAIFAVSAFSAFNIKTTRAESPAETAARRKAQSLLREETSSEFTNSEFRALGETALDNVKRADSAETSGFVVVGAVKNKIDSIKKKTAGILNIGSLGNNMVPTDDKKNNYKEKVLDSIRTTIAKGIIRQITVSTVNWINSGFQGGPAYVTDFGGFMRDIADEEIGRFIEGSALAFLCDPLDIKLSLALRYATPFEKEVECTLSDVVGNIDDFINGNFSAGGWDGWIELTTRPQNNRYGAYLSSAAELEARIQFSQFEEGQVLEFGSGFLSYKECDDGPYETPLKEGEVGPGRPQNCRIVTPGAVIEKQLANVLGSGVRQLELADEFNEIVNALMSQLIVKVFNSANDGLRGLSDESDGRPSYTSRLSTTENTTAVQNIIAGAEIEFSEVIGQELVYLTSKQGAFDSIAGAETKLLSLAACYESKLADKSLNLTKAEKAAARERIGNATSTIDTLITPRKNILISEINTQSALIIKLDSLLTDIQNATNPVQLQAPTSELESMRRQGLLRGSHTFAAEQERAIISSEMSALNTTTNSQITECQAFPPPPVPTPPPTP